jgi:hypothetical protein
VIIAVLPAAVAMPIKGSGAVVEINLAVTAVVSMAVAVG